MKILALISLLVFSFTEIQGQEEYYKSTDDRKENHEVVNLPNLSSKFTNFYIGGTFALRKPYSSASSNFGEFGRNSHSMGGLLGLDIGLNFNDNFQLETGAFRLINELQTFVYPTFYTGWGFTVGERYRQTYIPVRIKKRLFSLNRITKNASFNITGGFGFLVHNESSWNGTATWDMQEMIKSPNLSSFYVTLSNSESPIFGELGLEIKGYVSQRFELSVFGKTMFRKSNYIANRFEMTTLPNKSVHSYFIEEKGVSLVFGLQARFNSKKFFKYNSTI